MKETRLPTSTHPLNLERHWQIWAELVFISICHQTNWDRLHNRVLQIASNNFRDLLPETLLDLESKKFDDLFGPGLDSERVRRAERIALLRDLAYRAQDWPGHNGNSWILNETVHLSGNDGLYSWLQRFPMFSADPVQKKSRVFIHQLLRYGLIKVSDPEHIAPAVDYHLMRLYIRTGRVRPIEEELGERLTEGARIRIEPITALRRAVEESMYYTATGAELRVHELNHIEWQIARSFCLRKNPHCFSGPALEKPIDAAVAILSCKTGNQCPFSTECFAARDLNFQELVDPQSGRSYY
jgi:hypothetical protein